jgi:MYXO-CTERM domain-containing protein
VYGANAGARAVARNAGRCYPERVPILSSTHALAGALAGGLFASSPPSGVDEPSLARPTAPHIYGGELIRADETEYDAVVAVLSAGALCAGTLVAPDLVITAAHCVDGLSAPGDLRVVRGLTATLPLQEIGVTAFERHPDFCETGCPDDLRDFAWLRLAEPIDADLPRFVVTQAEWDSLVGKGRPVELVGYGEAETGNDGRKRKVVAEITGFLADGRELWAGGDGKDSCRGDSGGPAFVRDDEGALVLIGVLSRGRDCGEGGVYGVPQSEACWLREATSVDMAPGCEMCDCLRLEPRSDRRGCAVEAQHDAQSDLAAWLTVLLVVVGATARQRRRDLA